MTSFSLPLLGALAWIDVALVTCYMGPVAVALCVPSDKEPSPGTHQAFIRPAPEPEGRWPAGAQDRGITRPQDC